jgi:hypothetical protein
MSDFVQWAEFAAQRGFELAESVQQECEMMGPFGEAAMDYMVRELARRRVAALKAGNERLEALRGVKAERQRAGNPDTPEKPPQEGVGADVSTECAEVRNGG